MPLGEVEEDRATHYLPLERGEAAARDALRPDPVAPPHRRAGALLRCGRRIRLGLITPLTGNFCAGCNRIRVAATGTVYGCLGHDQKVELRDLLRAGGRDPVDAALDRLLAGKPKGHDFAIDAPAPAVQRHMSVTGG